MLAWINFAVLLFSSLLFTLFYVRSVSPAGREKIRGPRAFRLCFFERLVSVGFELIITACYILYNFFPLKTPLPAHFPWAYWISLIAASVIGIPALVLMIIGMRDAGTESIQPSREQSMFGGIYAQLRHPQAVGEVFLFPTLALLLNSPFLTIYSLVFFPIYILMCHAEEQDLLLRYGGAYADYCRQTGAFWPKKT